MKKLSAKLPTIIRVAFGLLFLVSGIGGLLHLIPQPALPDRGAVFMHALAYSGWILPLTKIVETLAGALLLANLWAPFALILLAPILVNVALFHLMLAPSGMPMALFLIGIEIYLAYVHRAAWRPLFASSKQPVLVGAGGGV